MADSKIEWTDKTWNPVTGCDKISPGCKRCYAARMAARLQLMGQPNYRNGFDLTLQPHMLELPLTWKKPQQIFVNSMSDLFHKDVPVEYVQRVFAVMRRAHWHRFQVLTKRADRLAELDAQIEWPPNIWQGVSVENDAYRGRIDDLCRTRARIKFLSLEPLLGPLPNLDLRCIDWVIVGGESGPKARPMDPAWVTDIRDQCVKAGVPFFFKQWGGTNKKQAGRILEERTWDEMPSGSASTHGSACVSPGRVCLPVLPASPQDKPPRPPAVKSSLQIRQRKSRRAGPPLNPDYYHPSSIHEAGHTVVAHCLGAHMTVVWVKRDRAGGRTCFWSRGALPPIVRATISIAGYLADVEDTRPESRRDSRVRLWEGLGPEHGLQTPRSLARFLRSGCPKDFAELREELAELPESQRFPAYLYAARTARGILRAHWPAVLEVAARLTLHLRLQQEEIVRLLAQLRVAHGGSAGRLLARVQTGAGR